MYKMQRLEVSGAVRPLYWSLGVKGLTSAYQLNTLNAYRVPVHGNLTTKACTNLSR